MTEWLGILILFLVGLRLSFFFSGIETAFYRASKLRLNIDAQTGDALSRKILKFASNPSTFVATILIGNNVANYITTCAISYGAILSLGALSEMTEVGVTVLMSPVIFVFGELLPKTLHYQAPLLMLKRYFWLFRLMHIVLLPLSWPLMMLTKLFQRVGGVQQQPMLRILGRRPLANVIGQGHEEGIVTGVQHDLIQGVFLNANKPLENLITPHEVAFYDLKNPTRAQLLEHARAFGLVEVSVLENGADESPQPYYYRISDLLIHQGALTEIRRPMPQIPVDQSRLEVLFTLQDKDADVGAVVEDTQIIGTVRRRVLTETLLQGGLAAQPALV